VKLDSKELKGLHSVKRKLANGSVREHHYAWRGGPAMKEKYGTVAFIREFERLTAERLLKKEIPQVTFASLITMFMNSTDFPKAERTKADYTRLLNNIEKKFGTLPLSAFKAANAHRTRGLFMAWRDELHKSSPRQGDYHWTVLARVCSVAKNRGKIGVNPCEKGGRFYKAKRQHIIWEDHELSRYYEESPEHLKLPVLLSEWTGQRQGDILKMRLSKGNGTLPWYEGAHVYVRQGKTEAFVKVRAIGPLKEALDAEIARAAQETLAQQQKRDGHVLVSLDGTPWTENGFRSSFGKVRDKVPGLKGKTFHDLRGTAITRLALAGASPSEIASVTGHDEKYVLDILKAHYLAPSVELAENAIQKLEARIAKKAKLEAKEKTEVV
jgi:integrase